MTRPGSLRLSDDEQTGARFADYAPGVRTGETRFDLEPGFITEYMGAAALDASLYQVRGRAAAPPQILTLYLMGTLQRRYAPLPGIVMAGLTMELHAPIWRDERTRIVSEGEILSKEERGARRFVTWRAEYRREQGEPLATLTNTFLIPS